MTFFSQIRGFFKRNFLLKVRNKVQTVPEIYNPVVLLAVLVLFNYILPSERLDAVDFKPEAFPDSSSVYAQGYMVPDTPATRDIAQQLEKQLFLFSVQFFNSTKDMKTYYLANGRTAMTYFGIEFNMDNFPYEYTIHTGWDVNLFSDKSVNLFANGNLCRPNKTIGFLTTYKSCAGNQVLYNGLSKVQYTLDKIIKSKSGSYPKYTVQNMPKGVYVNEQAVFTVITSIYFTLFFVNSLVTFVTNVVAEKEKKIKEVMRMMGMYDTAFWLSWILIYLVPFTIFNITVVIVMFAIGFFKTAALSAIFFFLMEMFSITTIMFGMLFSAFFQKSKAAGAACGSFYTISSLLYFVVFIPRQMGVSVPVGVQWLLSLVFPCAFSLAVDQALYTQTLYPNSFPAELFVKATRPGTMSILECFIMLIVDGILYFLLAIYFENIMPGEYGVAKPPWFFLLPSYWKDSNAKSRSYISFQEDIELEAGENSEPIGEDFRNKMALKVRSLVKTFKNAEKVEYNAIDKLNLNVYSGQITAILGHNGAGKTTLFNILTGLIKPNDGSVSFFNYDLFSTNDLLRIREMTGVCPQHDVLYDLLNCKEHLELFARLKGVPSQQIPSKAEELLKKVDLWDSRTTFSKDLSGGQKRKLSIAIALIGDPKVLILDEPTSGMDPQSRRAVWSLLQSIRDDRVILLATHFMDEADVLADRKAIITKGKLRCVGSSLFLKNKFGLGYHLNCITKDNLEREPVEITSFVSQHVPECRLERYHGKEVSYTLPLQSVPKFQVLFRELETSSRLINVESFGISMTTLEEVFLKLAEVETSDSFPQIDLSNFHRKTSDPYKIDSNTVINSDKDFIVSSGSINDNSKNKCFGLFDIFPAQLLALVKLRFLLMFRNKMTFIYRFIAPIPNIVLSILLPKIIKTSSSYDPNNLPRMNFKVNDYATAQNPFGLYNYTNTNLDGLVANLSVNSQLNPQPLKWSSNPYEVDFPSGSYAGFKFNAWNSPSQNDVTAFYNDSGLFAVPYLVNTMTNFFAGLDNSSMINASISALPKLASQCDATSFDASSFSSLIVLGLGFIMPAVTFAVEVVHDREIKCRSQLKLSGVGFLAYWGTSIFCFFIQYLILPVVLFTIVFAIPPLNIPAFDPAGAKFSIFLTTIIYMPCVLMFSMCLSFFFDKKETAIGALTTTFMLLFLIPYMAVTLSKIGSIQTSNILHLVFSFIDPLYGFVGTYSQISQIALYQQLIDCSNIFKNDTKLDVPFGMYFEFEVFYLPVSYIFGIVNLIIYTLILFYVDSLKQGINLFTLMFEKHRYTAVTNNADVIINEDSDVSDERARIMNLNLVECPLVLQELRKRFAKPKSINDAFARCSIKRSNHVQVTDPASREKIAVRNLSLSFRYGEVFGLLGPNGAGKTTTISMVTTDLQPDAGSIKILGDGVNMTNLANFYRTIGFCPQHNPFYDELTLREHLVLYATVKKIPKALVQQECDRYMNLFGIAEHADKRSKNLSGGTKRKLAFIIAMFGTPHVALLDEPSTGMDPSSKRTFWNIITLIFTHQKKSAILTTHSMEEAEALCHRIGIIVKGELKCLGSSQYLKEKFGMGYTLETKIKHENERSFLDFIARVFSDKATIIESFSNRFVFNIPRDSIKSLANVFAHLEQAKSEGIIIEYNFSQCTLEQVFIKFAREQES